VAFCSEIVTRTEAEGNVVVEHAARIGRILERGTRKVSQRQVDPTTQMPLQVFECGPSNGELANRNADVARVRALPRIARAEGHIADKSERVAVSQGPLEVPTNELAAPVGSQLPECRGRIQVSPCLKTA